MSSNSRYYVVTVVKTGQNRVVRAKSPAQALRYCVRTDYKVEVASQDDLVSLLRGKGVEVEIADAQSGAGSGLV